MDRPVKPQPSKAAIIRTLQHKLEDKQRQYEQLVAEKAALITKQDVLLQQVTQQGDNLHFIALAAAQTEQSSLPEVKTLLQDLEVHELMGMLGKPDSSPADAEPFTTQRLRAAVTPERVAAMRNVTVEEVAAHLKQLTMRMCMLLAAGPEKAALFSESLEAVVNAYGEYGLLLHVAADWVNLQIGTLNLETLQVQEPPPGYWECVVDSLQLQEQQVQTLAAGFNSYQQKSKPFISGLHSTVGSMRAILGCSSSGSESSLQQQQQLGSSSEPEGAAYQQFIRNQLGASGGGGSNTSSFSCYDSQTLREGSTNAAAAAAAAALEQPSSEPQQQGGSCSQHDRGRCGGSCQAAAAGGSCQKAAAAAGPAASTTKPWQEFGLSHGNLTAESAQQLEQLMQQLLQQVMMLREMHRTVTWLFLNTLDARQHALFITGSWPWWSRPLTMCQYIAEQHEQRSHHPQQQQRQQPTQQPKHSGGQVTCNGGLKPHKKNHPVDVTAATTSAVLTANLQGLQLGSFTSSDTAQPQLQQRQPMQQDAII